MNNVYRNNLVTYILGLYMFLLPWDGFLLETPLRFSLSFVFFGVLIVIYILHALKNHYYKVIMPKVLIPIFFILIYATFTLLWTPSRNDAFLKLSQMWSFLIIAILILSIVNQMKVNIKTVLWFYVLGTFSIGLYSLLMHGGYSDVRFTIAENFNPTWYAAFIVWSFVVSVKLLRDSKIFYKILLLIINMFLFILLLLTQGRNAILAVSVSFLIVLFIYVVSVKKFDNSIKVSIKKTTPIKQLKTLIVISFISGISLLVIFGTGLNEKLTRVGDISELLGGDSSKATAGRTEIWSNFLGNINEEALFGGGAESSWYLYHNVYAPSFIPHTPHNTYILTLVEYGIVGFLLWLYFIWVFIKYSLKNITISHTLTWIALITVFMAIGNDILVYKYWWTGIYLFLLISQDKKVTQPIMNCKKAPIK